MTTSLNYRVAACDLDSTVLHGSLLSLENRDAVQSLNERNVAVVLASGRNFHHVLPYYRTLGLTGPVVSNDGALVTIPGAVGEIISEQFLPLAVSSAIMTEAARRQLTCLNFFRHGIYTSSRFDWHEDMDRHREMGRHFRHSTVEKMIGRSIYKTLLFSLKPENLDAMQEAILAQFGDVVDAMRNNPNALELISKGVSKVSGLKAAAAYLGVDPTQVVAFGDGFNDASMFRWAGLSVCMSHGHEAAKEAATLVAPATNREVNFAAAVSAAFAPSHTPEVL
jgi:Cof subfamily protein (haloacid dehalogenase superfamily)